MQFLDRYDVLYDLAGKRVQLYQMPKQPATGQKAWLPATGALEIGPYQEKMNQGAVTAMRL